MCFYATFVVVNISCTITFPAGIDAITRIITIVFSYLFLYL